MMKMNRTAMPSCLSGISQRKYPHRTGRKYPKWKYWGFLRRDKPTNKKFDWYGTRDALSYELRQITHNHCSFCDSHPIGTGKIKDTIEHFRPKHLHPLLAYYWGNLFICCHYCQEIPKGWDHANDRLLLKPDNCQYDFHRYFIFDTATGNIEVNLYNESSDERKRADLTIRYYKLNDYSRPQARLDAFGLYQIEPDLNQKEYRFMFLP